MWSRHILEIGDSRVTDRWWHCSLFHLHMSWVQSDPASKAVNLMPRDWLRWCGGVGRQSNYPLLWIAMPISPLLQRGSRASARCDVPYRGRYRPALTDLTLIRARAQFEPVPGDRSGGRGPRHAGLAAPHWGKGLLKSARRRLGGCSHEDCSRTEPRPASDDRVRLDTSDMTDGRAGSADRYLDVGGKCDLTWFWLHLLRAWASFIFGGCSGWTTVAALVSRVSGTMMALPKDVAPDIHQSIDRSAADQQCNRVASHTH